MRHVSPSQINTWLKCQMQWYFRYIEGLKVPSSGAQFTGTTYHKTLAHNYEQKVETKQDIPATDAQEYCAEAFDSGLTETEVQFDGDKPGEMKDKAVRAVALHVTERAPALEPVTVEKKWELPLTGDTTLMCITDMTTTDHAIIDHKFSSRAKNEADLPNDIQANLYQWMMREIEPLEPWRFTWEVAVAGKTPKTQTLSIESKPKELEWFHQLAKGTVAAIGQATESGVFVPNPNGWWCSPKWCGYYDRCRNK